MIDGNGFLKRHGVRVLATIVIVALWGLTRLPTLADDDQRRLALDFGFDRFALAQDPGGTPVRGIRKVHPDLQRIAAWISSVGAAVALTDIDHDGLGNDVCHVDVRVDQVIISPAPGTGDRYPPFTLTPDPLPYHPESMAPMGCLPSDLNQDGLADIVVYYWGRTPVAFLRRAFEGNGSLESAAFRRQELLPYQQRWYTNAATQADFDGDGRVDLFFGNYFQDDSWILDPLATDRQSMHTSMSRALNGGRNRILRWKAGRSGEDPQAEFEEVEGVLKEWAEFGWTLAAGAADLDGDLLPELYISNDFGSDRLLHNRSRPGKLAFEPLIGRKRLTTPNSKVLGRDSFKGMGVDFADLNRDGLLDIYVSNIANEWALQESHFVWVSTGETDLMAQGEAPYVDRSEPLGLSRSGWSWESRFADFNNDGQVEALQATGFVKGEIDRWPELHETAMGNDELLRIPACWPQIIAGDDLSGDLHNPFFVQAPGGRFYDLAPLLGLDEPQVTRGIAVADVDGDGRLDFAVANQWADSYLYRNRGPSERDFLGLHLVMRAGGGEGASVEVQAGAQVPQGTYYAVGAAVSVEVEKNRILVGQVDGGNGHSGVRSPALHFGLGHQADDARIPVRIQWRDSRGVPHEKTLSLPPGWHSLILGSPTKANEEI